MTLSGKPIPTSKKNPCPVCGSTKPDCRLLPDETVLCQKQSGVAKFEVINGYKCVANRGNGWATFRPENSGEWNAERQQQREAEQRRRELQEKERQQRIIKAVGLPLSVPKRVIGNREFSNQTSLDPDHRGNLRQRGLTDSQIDKFPFRSVKPGQRVKGITSQLPGVGRNGEILVSDRGFTVPAFNLEGEAIAYQLRRDNASESKYRWFKSAYSSHIDGEMPLTICRDGVADSRDVYLCEGLLKALIFNQKRKVVVIGASGGLHASSPKQLKAALDALKPERVILTPDAGVSQNKHILRQYRATFELLQQWGYNTFFLWWGQTDKKIHPDIDELPEGFETSVISPDEFFAIPEQLTAVGTVEGDRDGDREITREVWEARHKKASTEESKPSEKSDEDIRLEKAWKVWRNGRRFTGDRVLNVPYLSQDNIEDPAPGTVTGIKSGLGTNKTGRLYDTIKNHHSEGWISFGYRNNLLIQFSEEAGFYHYQQDLKGQAELELLLKDPNSKITVCVDSIIHFKEEDFDGKNVIIDEAESVAEQLLTGDTAVARWRRKAKHLLEESLKRAKRIILLDGNLTDSTVTYIANLCGKKAVKVVNKHKGNCSNEVMLYTGSVGVSEKIKKNDRSPFLQFLFEKGVSQGAFAIGTDNQVFAEAADNLFKENGLEGYRLDSTTCNEGWVKEFLNGKDGPKNFIEKYQPDYLIYSPSAESGVSIDIKGYFKNLFFAFAGVVLVNKQLQIMKRIRDPQATMHVFCPPVGLGENGVSKSPFPYAIENAIKEYVIDCGQASLEGLEQAEPLNQLIAKLVEQSADPHFKRECELKAMANFERAHLRECLRECLIDSGYKVTEITALPDSNTFDVVKEAEGKIRKLVAEKTFNAPDISSQEAENLISSKGGKLTRDEKCKVNRRRLLDRLPGIEKAELDGKPVFSPEFVHQILYEDKLLISSLQRFYLLNNPEQAKRLQEDKWFWALTEATIDENPKPLDLSNHRSQWLRIKTLLDLGIQKFWEPNKTWSNDSEEVKAFYQSCQIPKIARNAGVSPKKDTPAAFVNKTLKNLGFRISDTRPTQEDGSRQRLYKVEVSPLNDPLKATLYQSIGQRIQDRVAELEQPNWSKILDQNLASEEALNPDGESVPARPLSASYLYKKPADSGRTFLKAKEEESEHNCSLTEEPEFTPLSPLASQLLSLTQEDGSVPCEAGFWEVAAPYLATPGDREVFEDAVYELGLDRGWRLLKLWQDGRQQQAPTEALQPVPDALQPTLEPAKVRGFFAAYLVKLGCRVLGEVGQIGVKSGWSIAGIPGLFKSPEDAAVALAMG